MNWVRQAERDAGRRTDGRTSVDREELWPAAGFVDTEIGCFMKPEVAYAAKTIWA
jgi:hypothetical protein